MIDDIVKPGGAVILQVQNSRKPEQIISVALDEGSGHFETQGLRVLFGLEEVWIERTEFMEWMDEFASVVSFLLETMSAAQDLNLPYGYRDKFEYKGHQYTLFSINGHRELKLQD